MGDAMHHPTFVVLEGPDRCGKGTQAKLTAAWMRSLGIKFWATCQPTDGLIGREIRHILRKEVPNPGADKLQAMFIEDRKSHSQQIKEALAHDLVVLSDRYWHSTLAYGKAQGLDFDELYRQNADFVRPGLVIVLDVSLRVLQERHGAAGATPDLHDGKMDLLKKVCDNYRWMANSGQFPEMVLVDGGHSTEDVFTRVQEAIEVSWQTAGFEPLCVP